MRVRLWLVLLVGVSVVAVGQPTLSGRWDATVRLLPAIGLDSELTLQAEVGGWQVGGTAKFYSADGHVWQTFDVAGMFGPLDFEWTLLFGPLAPAFLYTLGTATLELGGVELTGYTAYVGPTIPWLFFGGPSGGAVLVAAANLGGGTEFSAAVGFGARLEDFTISFAGVDTHTKTFPVNPFPGGLRFTYLELDLESIPFCCGITFAAEFAFTKEGFDYIEFAGIGLPLGLGVSLDVAVTYGVDEKSVVVTPRFAGFGEACLTVWGDALFDDYTWQGIELYGFRIRCELAECNYAEFLTAFNVAAVEEVLEEDVFEAAEFQYVKLGFCGPGCCGEQYTLDLAAYFQPMGLLFGVRRLTVDAGIPIMANLIWELALEVVVGGPASLATGWAFAF